MKTIFTTGTFDTLHIGHIRLLQRAKAMGDLLIVGLNDDDLVKHKNLLYNYEQREAMLEELRCVDVVVPLNKQEDKYKVMEMTKIDKFVIGDDYANDKSLDEIRKYTEVVVLKRTPNVSSTKAKSFLKSEYKTVVVDIDDTLLITHNRDFENSEPMQNVIDKVNELHDDGWNIILYTARGMKSQNNDMEKAKLKYEDITIRWLNKHEVKYDELLFGKRNADWYVDDKAMTIDMFLDFKVKKL